MNLARYYYNELNIHRRINAKGNHAVLYPASYKDDSRTIMNRLIHRDPRIFCCYRLIIKTENLKQGE